MDSNDLLTSLRSAFGGNLTISEADIMSFLQKRPGADKVKEFRQDPAKGDAFLARNTSLGTETTTRLTICAIIKDRANDLLKMKQYTPARMKYMDTLATILDKDFQIPLPLKSGLRNEKYVKLDTWEKVSVMECCNGMSKCMIGLGETSKALEWLEEVNTLWKNNYFSSDTAHWEWTDYNMQLTEYFYEIVTAFRTASEVFLEIGNTGVSVQRRWHGHVQAGSMPSSLDKKSVQRIVPSGTITDFLKLRHPEPQLVASLIVKHADLQIRGSWKKIRVEKPPGFSPRMGFASFVWDGYFYIIGGQKKSPDIQSPDFAKAYLRDMWYLNLEKLDGWKQLPSYPDKAYLFTGRPQIDYFDLKTKEWGSFVTSFMRDDGRAGSAPWPYPGASLTDYAMQMVDGRIYIFGGSHASAGLGCNLFVVLDLQTKQWRKLSGTVLPTPDYSCPAPRKWPATWVREDKMYIMHGVADRQAAHMKGQPNAAKDAFGHTDFWTWSFTDNKWRREIISGNPPSPRAEAGCTYNQKLDQTVIFGGYNPTYPTMYPDTGKMFNYSYYADTFIFSPSTLKWKQVLTRGFPTYRAQSQLVSDPESGKVFLFGGYTSADYIHSRKGVVSRSFGDLWQLCIDEPGGYFEGVDLADEARTAQAGPWRRCFACGCAGQWKKCGGACNGRVFFCDDACQKEGWKEHKTQHKCHKK